MIVFITISVFRSQKEKRRRSATYPVDRRNHSVDEAERPEEYPCLRYYCLIRPRGEVSLDPQQILQPEPVPLTPPSAFRQGRDLDLPDPFTGDAELLGDDIQEDAIGTEVV